MLNLHEPWSDHLTASAQYDLLFSVPCCFLLDGLIKETTCNVMVDHLQSRVTPWRQYATHVKVRGTLSKMDVLPINKIKVKKRVFCLSFGSIFSVMWSIINSSGVTI